MADPTPAPPGASYDRGPQMLAIAWSLTSIAVVAQFARLYARIRIRQLGLEDYIMFFTTSLLVAASGILTAYIHYGGGEHTYYLVQQNPQLIPLIIKYQYTLQPFIIVALGTGKASLGLLILRILTKQQRWLRYTVWVSIISVNIVLGVDAIIEFVQCNPPAKLWDLTIEGTCWPPSVANDLAIFSGVYSALADIVLAVVPLTVFKSLNMSLKNRISLSILFGCGLLAGIGGAYKTSTIPGIAAGGDFTWNSYTTTAWAVIETFLVIMAGTVPTLVPLWDMIRSKISPLTNSYASRKSGYKIESSHERPVRLLEIERRPNGGSSEQFANSERDRGIKVEQAFVLDVTG